MTGASSDSKGQLSLGAENIGFLRPTNVGSAGKKPASNPGRCWKEYSGTRAVIHGQMEQFEGSAKTKQLGDRMRKAHKLLHSNQLPTKSFITVIPMSLQSRLARLFVRFPPPSPSLFLRLSLYLSIYLYVVGAFMGVFTCADMYLSIRTCLYVWVCLSICQFHAHLFKNYLLSSPYSPAI